jgi:metal-dependent amidase/aminoacylase/carboxypeptidase family protein
MFHAGTARNVIPNEAVLAGTYRTYRPEVRDLVDQRLRETALAVAQAFGCTVEIQTRELTPPLINDAQTNRRLRATFNALAGYPDANPTQDEVRAYHIDHPNLFLL